MRGPDRLGGCWWENAHERDYFLVETRTAEILWMFEDRRNRSWYLHGFVD